MDSKQMKHTPGPWEVCVYDKETTIESQYQTIATDVSNCDADLIASAPDLLVALERIADMRDRDGNAIEMHRDELRGIARAAIAAIAKGE